MSGPRQRAAVATRMMQVLRRDTVRAIPSGWVISSPTGSAAVCRTYDELVAAVSRRSGVDVAAVREQGLPHR